MRMPMADGWMVVVNHSGVGGAKRVVVAVAFTLVTDLAEPPTYYINALTTTGQWVGVYQSANMKQAEKVLDALVSALGKGCKVFRILSETEWMEEEGDAKKTSESEEGYWLSLNALKFIIADYLLFPLLYRYWQDNRHRWDEEKRIALQFSDFKALGEQLAQGLWEVLTTYWRGKNEKKLLSAIQKEAKHNG